MLNELEEFKAYTEPVTYSAKDKRDTSYLGRFTFDTILEREGFARILTIIARGYMFGENGSADRARHALCAWNSVPDANTSTNQEWQYKSCFCEYHNEFPELVDENGGGWFYRHAHAIADFIKNNPKKVSKSASNKITPVNKDWDKKWRNKVIQMQTPIFHPATKGAWILRFDDILADAAELGELKDNEMDLPTEVYADFRTATPETVPDYVIETLVKYYIVNKPEDSDWVVLPVTNFDAFFGNTNFSKKWLNLLPPEHFEKQTQGGVCRYMVQ